MWSHAEGVSQNFAVHEMRTPQWPHRSLRGPRRSYGTLSGVPVTPVAFGQPQFEQIIHRSFCGAPRHELFESRPFEDNPGRDDALFIALLMPTYRTVMFPRVTGQVRALSGGQGRVAQ
jgi:hypothetical protein